MCESGIFRVPGLQMQRNRCVGPVRFATAVSSTASGCILFRCTPFPAGGASRVDGARPALPPALANLAVRREVIGLQDKVNEDEDEDEDCRFLNFRRTTAGNPSSAFVGGCEYTAAMWNEEEQQQQHDTA
jgi:hypothetical protein